MKGIIKVYGGDNQVLNREVRGWLESAGYMYYPCKEGEMLSRKMKEELGGEDGDVVVQRGDRVVVISSSYGGIMAEMYVTLEIAGRYRTG